MSATETRRLAAYTRSDLESKNTTGADSLRGLLRAEYAANNLPAEYLRAYGAERFGVWVSGCSKDDAIEMLLGTVPAQTRAVAPPALPIAPPAVETPAANPAAVTAMNALLAAIGGVNPESIRTQIKEEMAAPIADFNAKLADSKATIQTAIGSFNTWQTEQKAAVEKVKAEMQALRAPQVFEILKANGERRNVGVQHKSFGDLLALLEVACNVWLVGPAGSGKTFAAEAAAEAMELDFQFNGAIDSEHKLLGFTDAQGRVVSRPFRKCWEKGGLYLFDEVDASLPAALLAFNAALANGFCDFPDGKIDRHPNFRCVAGGNVWNGATADYCGRMKQDAAFLDRFVHLAWNYDETLERELAVTEAVKVKRGTEAMALEWTGYVQKVRAKAQMCGVRVVISPRASINGAKLLAAGKLTKDQVIGVTLRKGLDQDAWNKIQP